MRRRISSWLSARLYRNSEPPVLRSLVAGLIESLGEALLTAALLDASVDLFEAVSPIWAFVLAPAAGLPLTGCAALATLGTVWLIRSGLFSPSLPTQREELQHEDLRPIAMAIAVALAIVGYSTFRLDLLAVNLGAAEVPDSDGLAGILTMLAILVLLLAILLFMLMFAVIGSFHLEVSKFGCVDGSKTLQRISRTMRILASTAVGLWAFAAGANVALVVTGASITVTGLALAALHTASDK